MEWYRSFRPPRNWCEQLSPATTLGYLLPYGGTIWTAGHSRGTSLVLRDERHIPISTEDLDTASVGEPEDSSRLGLLPNFPLPLIFFSLLGRVLAERIDSL